MKKNSKHSVSGGFCTLTTSFEKEAKDMELLLYRAQCVGNQKNCHYPERTVVTNAD